MIILDRTREQQKVDTLQPGQVFSTATYTYMRAGGRAPVGTEMVLVVELITGQIGELVCDTMVDVHPNASLSLNP